MRSLWIKVDAIEAWHAKLVDKPWLQPLRPTKFVIALIVLSTLIAAGMSWYVRHWQYQVWEQNRNLFILTTARLYSQPPTHLIFWGLPRQLKKMGVFRRSLKLRSYPNALKRDSEEKSHSLRDVPLLSVVLSVIAKDTTQKAIFASGSHTYSCYRFSDSSYDRFRLWGRWILAVWCHRCCRRSFILFLSYPIWGRPD